MKTVVIVESPSKAKTINKYLGKDYEVIASFGHVRDLEGKNNSVRPDEDFAMDYVISEDSQKHVKNIISAVKDADKIVLASDPDREGEAIAWHIVEILKEKSFFKKKQISRVVFHEITKKAVIAAFDNQRDININLVNAQQARRALDYLVGFKLSPILWRKLPGSKSAGRVQSVALRLICEREDEIERFISQEYWKIKALFKTFDNSILSSFLNIYDNKKLDKLSINNKEDADNILKSLQNKKYYIKDIETKKINKNPAAPFTTSTLQQEASRKLGFSTKKTMMVAQKLYEGVEINGETTGLITYMRTDSVQLSQESVNMSREYIKSKFGNEYVPQLARHYKSKAKNAQEAHEAIRPTDINKTPEMISHFVDKDFLKLYDLIWKRTVACQMSNAVLNIVSIIISSEDNTAQFRCSGSTIIFDGFYKLYQEGLDDASEDEYNILPKVNIGDKVDLDKLENSQHFTEPPPRYTEASLVKKMEELGIGRPSTYSSIISVLQDREYVRLDNKRFFCEDRGLVVTAFLSDFFQKYIEYDFTSDLENRLDDVSNGLLNWKELLNNFWTGFKENIEEVKDKQNTDILEKIAKRLDKHFFPNDEEKSSDRICPECKNGHLVIKIGKYGIFLSCSSYPECKYTKHFSSHSGAEESEDIINQDLGIDPNNGKNVYLRKGPYGFYVQIGDNKKEDLKRVSIPKNMDIKDVNLEISLKLLALPREVGIHPETMEPITAGLGKFGPYLLYKKKFYSLKAEDDILQIGINRAIAIIEDSSLKSKEENILGNHPETGEKIIILNGKYGPYIKCNGKNYSIEKTIDAKELTIEKAVEIIDSHKNNSTKKNYKKKK